MKISLSRLLLAHMPGFRIEEHLALCLRQRKGCTISEAKPRVLTFMNKSYHYMLRADAVSSSRTMCYGDHWKNLALLTFPSAPSFPITSPP